MNKILYSMQCQPKAETEAIVWSTRATEDLLETVGFKKKKKMCVMTNKSECQKAASSRLRGQCHWNHGRQRLN